MYEIGGNVYEVGGKRLAFGGNMCKASVNAGNAENVGGKSRYLVAYA